MAEMDDLQNKLWSALQNIPAGGGEMGAYGIKRHAEDAARIIREMIEAAVAERTTTPKAGDTNRD